MSLTNLRPIELTPDEEALAGRIAFDLSHRDPAFLDKLRDSCSAAAPLVRSLLQRGAIPEIRRKYFTDPAYNIGTKRSRKQAFEENGTRGEDILRDGNFLKHLRYFIFGPNLPRPVIEESHRIATADPFYPGDDIESLCQFTRSITRRSGLDRHVACEEFFKLALECGLPLHYARSVRDAVLSVR